MNTELGRAVANRVFTYAPNIDKNEEYIVISVLDGLCGQRQTAIVNVNIYYPDIREVRGDAKVENVSRTRELSDIAEKAAAIDLRKPPLPPGVEAGGHGGSHGYLGNEFVEAILEQRKPLVDIACALNTTVSGVVAHQSAMRDGEHLTIPQYVYPFEK